MNFNNAINLIKSSPLNRRGAEGKSIIILLLFLTSLSSFSQSAFTIDDAVKIALKNNQLIQSNEYKVEYFKELKKTSTDLGKLSATWMHGQYNSLYQDNNLQFNQSIPFPTVLNNQAKLGREQVIGAEKSLVVAKNELAFEVKSVYSQLLYQEAIQRLLLSQDSLYEDFFRASSLRYKTGESNLLEKTTAETQLKDSKNQASMNQSDIEIAKARLQALLKYDASFNTIGILEKRELPSSLDSVSIALNPQLSYLQQQTTIYKQAKVTERSRMLPDLNVGYFNQSLVGVQNINGQDQYFGADKRFQGFQLGVSFPLWFAPQVARSKAAVFVELESKKNADHFKTMLSGVLAQAQQELNKHLSSLDYYETSALKNATLILSQASKAFKAGEISYIEYLQSLKIAIGIKSGYLQELNLYNQSVLKIEFLMGTY
jgi:cobalt-zinc-cadmium resistance protein CzcA